VSGLAAALLGLALHAAPPAAAQWSTGSFPNTPVALAPSDQRGVKTVPAGAGGVVLVWEDSRVSGSFTDVYAQRLDAAGLPLWTADGVAVCTAPNSQLRLTAVPDGSGGIIVGWTDYRNGDADVYAQRVDGTGRVRWSPGGLPVSGGPGEQWDPDAAPDGRGGAFLCWYEARGDSATDLFAQRIDSLGTALWQPGGTPVCRERFSQVWPKAAPDSAGGLLVLWTDLRNADLRIFAQKLDAAGARLWDTSGVEVCGTSEYQYEPLVAHDARGGMIVSWHDFRSALVADIYAQRVGPDGARPWGTEGVLLSGAPEDQYNGALVTDGSGGAIAAWQDRRVSVSFDIYARRVGGDGSPLWSADGMPVCVAPNDQQVPRAAPDGLGGVFLMWADQRGGPNTDLWVQHLGPGGTPSYAPDGVPFSTAANGQSGHDLAFSGAGSVLAGWADGRTGTHLDIYAHRLTRPSGSAAFGLWAGASTASQASVPFYGGLRPGADDGVDSSDAASGPAPVTVVTRLDPGGPVENYRQDIRALTPAIGLRARRWKVDVRTSSPGADVAFHAEEDRIPPAFRPVLYDSTAGVVQDLRAVPVVRYVSPSPAGTPRSFDILLGDSTRPSTAVVSPNGGETLTTGFPVTVRFRSSDSSGVLRHIVYFQESPLAPPQLIDSTGGADTALAWTPPVVTGSGRLVVVAVDSVLNAAADTSDAPFTVTAGDSVARALTPQWNFVSVPLLQTDMTPAGIFADDLGSAPTMFAFRPSTNSYTFPDTLRLGQGYWLLASAPGGVVDAVGTPRTQVVAPTERGWNIIGNPFPVPFLRTALRLTDGSTTRTIEDAAAAGWVRDLLYGFNGTGYVIELSSLAVWNAYWLEVLVPGINVHFDVQLNSSGTAGLLRESVFRERSP
jgi:hypothetical protein